MYHVADLQRWMESNRPELNPANSEFLCDRFQDTVPLSLVEMDRHSISEQKRSEPVTITCVRSGVKISSDLSLERRDSGICSTCFNRLCQIRRLRRSLDIESATSLIHAVVASGVDYCNTVLAGSPRFITDRLH